MMLNLVIYGIPQPKQSFRHRVIPTKSGKHIAIAYQTKEVKQNEDNLRSQIVNQLPEGFKPFSGAVGIEKLVYVFPPPKSLSKGELKMIELGFDVYKPTKPDLTDNLNKGLFDSMQGVVFINDSQVVRMRELKKIYGLTPRIEVVITEINPSVHLTQKHPELSFN